MSKHHEPVRLGDVRPSQVMWSNGPGSLIDLPHLAVIGLGLDFWDCSRARSIREPRLLQAVRRELGYQVDQLLAPPIADDDQGPGRPPANRVADGIPVVPFPRWLRCPICGTLAEYDSGLFELKTDAYRPDRTRFVHTNCQKAKGGSPRVVPARFLAACRGGHLDDFPWRWFVHRGASKCKGSLIFYEVGASLQTENLWVKCTACDASRSMLEAFGEEGKKALPACRGNHPHLQTFEDGCNEDLRPVLLGASNSWFPVTLSALAIPTGDDKLAEQVKESWHMLSKIEKEEQLELGLDIVKESGRSPRLFDHSSRDIWKAIEKYRSRLAEEGEEETVSLKDLEWEVLTSENPPTNWPDFSARHAELPSKYAEVFESVLLVERLRGVNALVGFTRVEPPEEGIAGAEPPPRAPLSRYSPSWVPATEVRGEGIFIQFAPDRVREWLELNQVTERIALLLKGHRRWRAARRLEPVDANFPGAVHILVHSFAHILLRELALECGYNEASIRERIYASGPEDKEVHAGLLLYTAAADSDGTLGGLVELGKPENLGRLISQGLKRAQVCASDPLCSEHSAANDGTLHGAACHACSFVSETSCELGNRYLDRALVTPTLQVATTAFFGGQVS